MPKIETGPLKKRHLGWMSECRKKNVIVAAAFLAMTHCKPPAGAVAPVFDLSRVISESSFNIGTLEWRCCTARSKSLTSLCRLQSHPAQYVSGIPSAAILLSISHPIRCSTRCLANVRARISGPMIAL